MRGFKLKLLLVGVRVSITPMVYARHTHSLAHTQSLVPKWPAVTELQSHACILLPAHWPRNPISPIIHLCVRVSVCVLNAGVNVFSCLISLNQTLYKTYAAQEEHCNIHSTVSLGTSLLIVSLNTKSLFSKEFETVIIKCAPKFNRDCLAQNIPLVIVSGPHTVQCCLSFTNCCSFGFELYYYRHYSFENQYNDNWCSWTTIQMFLNYAIFLNE